MSNPFSIDYVPIQMGDSEDAAVQRRIISQPVLPVVEPITVQPGSTIVLTGKVLSVDECGEARFNLDLCCGLLVNGDHRDNVALHLNPRFDLPGGWFSGDPDRDLVINSLINNEWGKEERYSNPFKVGEEFKLEVRMFANYCKIAVNNRHVCDFEHRVPLDYIKCLLIQGCIKIETVVIP